MLTDTYIFVDSFAIVMAIGLLFGIWFADLKFGTIKDNIKMFHLPLVSSIVVYFIFFGLAYLRRIDEKKFSYKVLNVIFGIPLEFFLVGLIVFGFVYFLSFCIFSICISDKIDLNKFLYCEHCDRFNAFRRTYSGETVISGSYTKNRTETEEIGYIQRKSWEPATKIYGYQTYTDTYDYRAVDQKYRCKFCGREKTKSVYSERKR